MNAAHRIGLTPPQAGPRFGPPFNTRLRAGNPARGAAGMGLRILLFGATVFLGACNPFDDRQVPMVSVGKGLRPVIAWTPAAAYELRVYAGDKDGDRSDVMAAQGLVMPAWYARGPGGYENSLHSPVTYGVPPPGSEVAAAPPLVAGGTYTVTVFRMDERGSGDGFTNTRHRYVGTLTFVAGE